MLFANMGVPIVLGRPFKEAFWGAEFHPWLNFGW